MDAETASAAPAPQAQREDLRAEIKRLVEEHFESIPPLPDDCCPLSVPLFGGEEVYALLETLLDREVTAGRRVREFEDNFAEFIGSKHAIMVNSGSSANLLALSVLAHGSLAGGLRPGDEVIVPAVAWSTTLAPVLQVGCVPVLVDVDPETLNLRPDSIAEAMSSRTRALLPTHLLGNPVDMNSLMEVAKEHDLWVIEDTCESLGSSVGERMVGSFGHLGTFSFYFSHHITTVEGGMLITDDDRLADLARSMRAHGWTRDMSNREELEAASPWIDPRFLFVNLGYNLRPTELQAAFGLVQLGRLEEFNDRRRANARFLVEALGDLTPELTFRHRTGGRPQHLVRVCGDASRCRVTPLSQQPPRRAPDRDQADRRRQPRRAACVPGQPAQDRRKPDQRHQNR